MLLLLQANPVTAAGVHLYLGEHASVVQTAASVVELIELGNSVLLVTVLSSNQEGGS
jgi:hypothetical protein